MTIPTRPNFILRFRNLADGLLIKLPLPRINPSIISVLSIFISLLFVIFWPVGWWLGVIFLSLTLFFDWLDGAVAKKFEMQSRRGWLIDVFCDRLSEVIIFLPFFNLWFYLVIFNILLSIFSFSSKRHLILPLRFAFLLYLIFFVR